MMMLARVASSLYWLGRYVERADFAALLGGAPGLLAVLSTPPSGAAAWQSRMPAP